MGKSTGWKIATATLSLTTLGLGTALLTRPEPGVEVRTVRIEVPAPERAEAEPEPSTERPRVKQEPAPEERRRTDADVMEELRLQRVEEAQKRLAEMSVEDVCRKELLPQSGVPAPIEVVVARLGEDQERAAELMFAWWAAQHSQAWQELGLKLAPHFAAVFVQVGGAPAADLVRAEWSKTRDQGLMSALVRAGDAETILTLDEDHRKPHPRRRVNPYLLVTLGDGGNDLVWGWIEDESVDRDVRTTAIAGMWASGTEADRQRLWRTMDDTIRVVHFAPHAPRDGGVWSERIRERAEAMLDDPDPWVRVHGALAVMQNSFIWGNELARRGEAVATETTQLPMPGGRDANEWKALLHKIQMNRPRVLAKSTDEAAIREALGLE